MSGNHRWIAKPTETFHGFRLVEHNEDSYFLEQVDSNDKVRQSLMFDGDEIDRLAEAIEEMRE